MHLFKKTSILFISTLCCSIFAIQSNTFNAAKAANKPSKSYPVDLEHYYDSLDDSKSGTQLLSALQALNSSKRKSTVGYNSMGTSPSGMFKYTDYDPNYTAYDDNGQIYGTKILSFYSGKSTTSWNREHVWPNSRGGGSVDNDIFMPRPTITQENSDRGNSSYITGMAHSKNGWDPVTAFADNIGVYNSIRGECARISFYCAVANSSLKIKEGADLSYNNSMGDLISLLEWHVDNPINDREKNRNNGGQYLQGNRNPFVDHPEYVCRIWGNTNDKTKSICSRDPYQSTPPTSITLNESTVSLTKGETFNLSVSSVIPSNASKNVTWSSGNASIATVDNSGKITAVSQGSTIITATSTLDSKITANCVLNVSDIVHVESISLNSYDETLSKNGTFQLSASVLPVNATNKQVTWSSSNSSIARVSSSGLVTAVSGGSVEITATSVTDPISTKCNITVTSSDIKVTSVALDKYSATIKEGELLTLTPIIEPHNATNKNVTWNSSDTNVGYMNGNVFYSIGLGTTTVTVTTQDGGFTASCIITVTSKDVPTPSPDKKGGCGGNIASSSIVLVSLVGISSIFLFIKKRRKHID